MIMVEKVARAIAAKRNARRVAEGAEDVGVLPWDFDDASAAIDAMREPDAAMQLAGMERMKLLSAEGFSFAVTDLYSNMVAAARTADGSIT